MVSEKNIIKLLRLILGVFFLILLSWLFYQNLVVRGELRVHRNFCLPSRLISKLYPEDRVGRIERQEENCWQRIFVEPVYFKIKVPRTFSEIELEIVYQNYQHSALQLGLMKKKHNPLDWEFQLKKVKQEPSLEWQRAQVKFQGGAEYLTDHALEFMISAPGLTAARHEIKIKEITVHLSRPPFNWQDFWQDLQDYLIEKIKKQ
ncbi:hypothetical protein K9K85_01935 [Patescibacteria group bacterium]|nr:hypothetical protein [Patescibacteria group bacterium]